MENYIYKGTPVEARVHVSKNGVPVSGESLGENDRIIFSLAAKHKTGCNDFGIQIDMEADAEDNTAFCAAVPGTQTENISAGVYLAECGILTADGYRTVIEPAEILIREPVYNLNSAGNENE